MAPIWIPPTFCRSSQTITLQTGTFLGQKSCRTEVPGIFKISSRTLLRIFPNYSRSFRASFRGRRRPEKIHQKSPPFFNANPQANPKKKSTKVFWRAGKVILSQRKVTGRHKGGFVIKGGFGECTLVPVFVQGEHANVASFWFSLGEHPNVPSFRFSFRGLQELTALPRADSPLFALSKNSSISLVKLAKVG